jgi:predicted nucleotidyltransferase
MKQNVAIKAVSQVILDDGLCTALLLQGSFGRGEEDEFSDVDMFAVVPEENHELFLSSRIDYLMSYMTLVIWEEVNFHVPEIVAIFEDCLHFDLYTATPENLPIYGKFKVLYDKDGRYEGHSGESSGTVPYDTNSTFTGVIYSIVEADSAYRRRNFPWAAFILTRAIKDCGLLLRSLYDSQYPFLALKKINTIIPAEEFRLLEEASANLNEHGFSVAVRKIAEILICYAGKCSENAVSDKEKLLEWLNLKLGDTLFIERGIS